MRICLIVFSIIVVAHVFSSCNKENTKNTFDLNKTYQTKDLLYKITQFSVIEDKRLIYSLLEDSERYKLWLAYLERESSTTSYTLEQRKAIQQLKNRLTLGIFQNNSDDRTIFQTIWLPEWIKNFSPIFTDYEIYNIAFNLNNSKDKTTTETQKIAVESSCFCALHSRFTCPSFSFPISISNGTCLLTMENACKETTKGCGALFDQECDGNSCPQDRD